MSLDTIARYLLAAMGAFYAQDNHQFKESPEVTEERYEEFAYDVAFTVTQPYVQPLFEGRGARTRTGLVLVSIASFESGFREDVMSCALAGDKNSSWGPFQSQPHRELTCLGDARRGPGRAGHDAGEFPGVPRASAHRSPCRVHGRQPIPDGASVQAF